MNKKKIIPICLILLIIVLFYKMKGYSIKELSGTYINNYYEGIEKDILVPPDAPNTKDTLILFSDGTYKNSHYSGKYKLDRDVLYLSKWNESYGLTIKKSIFSTKIKLSINSDCTYYYEKIK